MKVYHGIIIAVILSAILAVIKVFVVKTMSLWLVFMPCILFAGIFVILFVTSIVLLIKMRGLEQDGKDDNIA